MHSHTSCDSGLVLDLILTSTTMSEIRTHLYLGVGATTSWFACSVINWFLYGALTVRLYLYHISFPAKLLKVVVYLVYVVETVQTILATYDLGRFMLASYPGSAAVIIAIPVCGGLVAFLTQAMYADRILALAKLKYVSEWCILVLVVIEFVAVIVMSPFLVVLNYLMLPAFQGWASISLMIDTIIAGFMVWSLRRNKIISKQLKSKVTRLVHLIIGTGILTAATNLVTLVLLVLGSAAAFGPAIILSKLYANSMMVSLNDRITSGHGHETFDTVIVPRSFTIGRSTDTSREEERPGDASSDGKLERTATEVYLSA